eukprot:CAMPEP_0182445930 /NCGR_PEP_ID=MMETSP1172-20130603/3874_1 /TAXON_ID=708627 /ORGANISM="Timspurckia oligopyrenoides, Strain CCMP3278" /LENGTH=412 /DNA_ID=CAMNT_0024641769 /DNA_START=104 /DNA_END=1342 /DNA_ORIENTATION=-
MKEEKSVVLPKLPDELSGIRVGRVLGKGGFGMVFEAFLPDQNQTRVALKVVPKIVDGNSNDSALIERNVLVKLAEHSGSNLSSRKEMESPRRGANKTNTDFFVRLLAAFHTRSHAFLVLDLAEGGDLGMHLIRERVFGEESVQFYCAEILLALQRLHSLGIIHRDVKPSNVLLDQSGHVLLSDLGLATELKVSVDPVALPAGGTIRYMPPEVLNGESSGTFSSDLYSLGVLMFECLGGRRPSSPGRRVAAAPDLGNLPLNVSDIALDLLKRLLHQEPSQRLQTVEEAMRHPFFSDVEWDRLRRTTAPARVASIERKIRASGSSIKFTRLGSLPDRELEVVAEIVDPKDDLFDSESDFSRSSEDDGAWLGFDYISETGLKFLSPPLSPISILVKEDQSPHKYPRILPLQNLEM